MAKLKNLVDQPGEERKVHRWSIPTLGGVVIFGAIVFSYALWFPQEYSHIQGMITNFKYLFACLIILFFVDPFIEFNSTFLIAMSHQIFLVSFGAFTILMFLIKNNSASKTVTVFFLIPATTAFMAWIFLNEQLTAIDLIGFLIASLGVFIATRNK